MATDTSEKTGVKDSGVVHIELLPDWKDPLCPGKQRVALLMADESIPYARRKRFSRMIKTKKKLTGEIVFDHNIGWKHILSLDDEVYEDKLDAEDVNAAIEYAMMKEGSATKSKHTSYNKLESDFYSSLGKLHRMDMVLREKWSEYPEMEEEFWEQAGPMPRARTPMDPVNFHALSVEEGKSSPEVPVYKNGLVRRKVEIKVEDKEAVETRKKRVMAAFDLSQPMDEIEDDLATGSGPKAEENLGEDAPTPRVDLTTLERPGTVSPSKAYFPAVLGERVTDLPALVAGFYKAAGVGDYRTLMDHVRAGVDVNAKVGGETALHLAARSAQMETLRALLGLHANPNTRDRKGLIPLQHAIKAGFYDGFSILMKRCENPLGLIDREGNTMLHLSVMHPHSVGIVRDILKIKDLDVRVKNDAGKNVMDLMQEAKSELMFGNDDVYKNNDEDEDDAEGGGSGLRERLDEMSSLINVEVERVRNMLKKMGMNTMARKPYMPTKDRAFMFKIPKKLKPDEDFRMTSEWLSEAGLFADAEIYAKILLQHEIGYDLLYSLTDEGLKRIGISKIGVRNKIMAKVREIKPLGQE